MSRIKTRLSWKHSPDIVGVLNSGDQGRIANSGYALSYRVGNREEKKWSDAQHVNVPADKTSFFVDAEDGSMVELFLASKVNGRMGRAVHFDFIVAKTVPPLPPSELNITGVTADVPLPVVEPSRSDPQHTRSEPYSGYMVMCDHHPKVKDYAMGAVTAVDEGKLTAVFSPSALRVVAAGQGPETFTFSHSKGDGGANDYEFAQVMRPDQTTTTIEEAIVELMSRPEDRGGDFTVEFKPTEGGQVVASITEGVDNTNPDAKSPTIVDHEPEMPKVNLQI